MGTVELSLEEKVGQLFMIGLPGPGFDDAAKALVDVIGPGGYCLFARNIRESAQTRALTDGLREASCFEPLIALDQEGGLVDRLRRIVEPMPAAAEFQDSRDVERFGKIVAEAIRTLGFNMDLAPVVDIGGRDREGHSNGLTSRIFGRSASETTEFAAAFLNSLRSGGALGCIKHFPGLGAASVDSHDELPVVGISESELRTVDLEPYRQMIASGIVDAVMVGHAAYPNLSLQERDPDGRLVPSSLSRGLISGMLRGELGYEGLVISDDLEMGAIVNTYGIGEACRMAIEAGTDMLAICAGEAAIREGFQAVLGAARAGDISEQRLDESLSRIDNVRSRLSPPLEYDEGRLAEISNEIRELKAHLEQQHSEVFS